MSRDGDAVVAEFLKDKIDLTVVIPLYNKKETVRRAIESVLFQLDSGDYIIVVDDGSSDGSAGVVSEIKDPRLCVISQDNQGVSVARNRGIDAAKTEYVAFLDADDWWLSGAVFQFKKMIKQCPECFLFCIGHIRSLPELPVKLNADLSPEDEEVLEGAAFIRAYSNEQLVNSSASCVKKLEVKKIGGFPVGALRGEDIYLWLRMALLGSVAVSRRPRVVIERPAPGVGRPDRDAIPYHVQWFSDPRNFKRLNRYERAAISRFLFYRGIKMCAGEVMAKRRVNAIRQINAISRISPAFFIVGALIILMPREVFRLLYMRKYGIKSGITDA